MAQVIYTIPDAKLDEFKTGFLAFVPVPTNDDGDPIMTESQWIKRCGKIYFINAYKKGKMILAHKAIEFTENIIG